MATQKAFSVTSKNLWFQVTLLILGIIAGIGVKLPGDPAAIAENLVNTLSTSGVYAVIGIAVVSIIGPIYNFIQTKPKITFSTFADDPNNWVYVGSFAASMLILLGVPIPDGTAQEVVRAIFVKDWAGLAAIFVGSVLTPLVRFFIDKSNKPATL